MAKQLLKPDQPLWRSQALFHHLRLDLHWLPVGLLPASHPKPVRPVISRHAHALAHKTHRAKGQHCELRGMWSTRKALKKIRVALTWQPSRKALAMSHPSGWDGHLMTRSRFPRWWKMSHMHADGVEIFTIKPATICTKWHVHFDALKRIKSGAYPKKQKNKNDVCKSKVKKINKYKSGADWLSRVFTRQQTTTDATLTDSTTLGARVCTYLQGIHRRALSILDYISRPSLTGFHPSCYSKRQNLCSTKDIQQTCRNEQMKPF